MYQQHREERKAPPEDRENYSLDHVAFSAIDISRYVEERRFLEDKNAIQKFSEEESPTIRRANHHSSSSERRTAIRKLKSARET